MKLRTRPTERIKARYILFEGKKEDAEKALLDYLGLLGWAKASPVFVKENIVSVDRAWDRHARAALALASIKVVRVSGTLAGLKR
jgi:RNase P/RNase MRP subunit POP5